AVRPAADDEAVLGLRVPSVAAVCVYPSLVPIAKEELAGSGVKVASVATGFPSGQYPLSVRLRDCAAAIKAGADEIDMVINRGALLSGRYKEVAGEIPEVASLCVGNDRGEAKSETAKQRNSETGANGTNDTGLSTQHSSGPSVASLLKVILET